MQNSLFSFCLSSGGIVLKVIFENQKLGKQVFENSFIQKYIPGVEFTEIGDFDATVFFSGQEICFKFEDYPQLVIGVKNMSEKDIISLIELVFERARQGKGIYCIHSATAIFKNKAVVFWGGASGMGKTRLAKLLSEQGGKFYSDEKTLINLNKMEVIGNIPYQYLDKNYWKKDFKDVDSSDSYYKIEERMTTHFPLAVFVYGFAINGAEFSSDHWLPEKFEWHLYEELGRKIRAISRRINDGKVSVPSLDTQENADKRIANIKKLVESIPCYSIQGSPENIIKYLKDLEIWA